MNAVTKKEYVIWGIAPGKQYEEILITDAGNEKLAQDFRQKLIDKYGCKNVRIQVLEFEPVNYNPAHEIAKMLNF